MPPTPLLSPRSPPTRPESSASLQNTQNNLLSPAASLPSPRTPHPSDSPELQARALTLALNSLDTPSPTSVLARMRQQYGSPPARRYAPADDRFIPAATSIQSFRMGSPAGALAPADKSRDRSVSPERPPQVVGNMTFGMTAGMRGAGRAAAGRRISAGAVGVFGIGVGAAETAGAAAVNRGREVNGHIFQDKESPEVEMERHELWLSAALGVDRSKKVFSFQRDGKRGSPGAKTPGCEKNPVWEAVVQKYTPMEGSTQPAKKQQRRIVPSTPFRVLDAPGLRDDYYCSLIAYAPLTHSLAVGLHSDVYNWSETGGAQPFEPWSTSHVTSLAYSSLAGGNNILAIGRIDGSLSLWTPTETSPRIDQPHSAGIACIAWKPTITEKPFSGPKPSMHTPWYSEELLVGDEMGNVYLYSIEWSRTDHNPGAPRAASIKLLRKISVHVQQICGLAWSADGGQFATGGNDNVAHLFDTPVILAGAADTPVLDGAERYRWPHGAAVKAMAFCPWQRSLLATGGGSNDRCIHFFHTFSGAPLATINVSAQVTSLLWSTTHREIAATFGYANPDHPVRIAVFSWPECRQVVQVPWQEDMRALYAVAYPGGPAVSEGSVGLARDDDEDRDEVEELLAAAGGGGKRRERRKRETEGCIVVAASDETVRFHEVWSESKRGVLRWRGVLGGSDILEGLEGIEGEGREMIR